jgi:AraC family transcriptional regulator
MHAQPGCDLSTVAAQLVEAERRARAGDSDGARVHIVRAIAMLDLRQWPAEGLPIARGGFAAWQSRQLAAHVEANLAGKIIVKDMADSLHISVGHFCRAFKHSFGVTARSWIRQRRIELAQSLMLTTAASLSEIALSCGMSDQSHFTRSFRRVVGETPSSWRQTRTQAPLPSMTQAASARTL